MLIECLIKRPGPTTVSVGGQFQFVFKEDPKFPGRKLAFVSQPAHIEYFLKSPNAYREFNPKEGAKDTSSLAENINGVLAMVSAFNAGTIEKDEFENHYDRMMKTVRALETRLKVHKTQRFVSPLDTNGKSEVEHAKEAPKGV